MRFLDRVLGRSRKGVGAVPEANRPGRKFKPAEPTLPRNRRERRMAGMHGHGAWAKRPMYPNLKPGHRVNPAWRRARGIGRP